MVTIRGYDFIQTIIHCKYVNIKSKFRIFICLLRRYFEIIDKDTDIIIRSDVYPGYNSVHIKIWLNGKINEKRLLRYFDNYKKLYTEMTVKKHKIKNRDNSYNEYAEIFVTIDDSIDEDIEILYGLERVLGLRV